MQASLTRQDQYSRAVLWLALIATAIVWSRTAWLSDDAGITLRVVLNFINGLGPNFNVDERVQVYTHPLWFLLLSAAVASSGELYYTSLGISLACTLLAVYSLLRWSLPAPSQRLLLIAILLSSRAFVDYASSGLENPLSYLLLVLFLLALYRSPLDSTSMRVALLLSACLLVLNRLDCGLLVLPALLTAIWRTGGFRHWLGLSVLCGLPFFLWSGFSLAYYGALVPNTAYAKLTAGLGVAETWRQGGYYLLDSLHRDYLTLPAICAAGLLALVLGQWRERALAMGMACYCVYIVSIGGDFMSGRFLAVPLLLAAFLLARQSMSVPWRSALAVLVLVLGLLAAKPVLLSTPDYRGAEINRHGISDERGFYYPNTGLMAADPPPIVAGLKNMDWRYRQFAGVRRSYTLGLAGLKLGQEIHLYDPLGLADPLLSRLPQGYGADWRPGHYQRRIPRAYPESLRTDSNLLQPPALADFYDDLRLATRAPLWTAKRWRAIVRLNFTTARIYSRYNQLPDSEFIAEEPFYRRP